MERAVLNAELREDSGKSVARKLRAQGKIPGTVYSKGTKPESIVIDLREFVKLMHKYGDNAVIDLKVNKSEKNVIIKEMQFDYVKEAILHIDLHQIKMTDKIKVNVPVVTKGDQECPGVKEGATLEHVMRELEVECFPTKIPHEIAVDVSALEINDAVHVKDITLGEGITAIADPESMVVLVKFEAKEEDKPEGEETEETKSAEPEVIKQKKPEEGA